MSHFGDYMDGVPVKISEKYRRPPTIELPYSVIECPQRAQNVVDSVHYDTRFEENVLAKIKELRSAKETKKNERRHRLQLLEEEKQRKLDEIAAAEAQEKLKQLSVSEVSYPSTEEINVLAVEEKQANVSSQTQNSYNHNDIANTAYPTCSSAEPELNILQPIQVQASYPQKSLLDDPDPLQELKNKYAKVPMYNNIDSMTFKDFEHDTSSPFDNVELKTINDREQLAQVLQIQGTPVPVQSEASSITSCPQTQTYMPEQMYGVTNCPSQPQIHTMPYYMEQSMQTPSVVYSQQSYPITNGYYGPPENICDNTMPPVNNVNMYMPSYQYYVPPTQYVVDPNYYNNPMPQATDTLQNDHLNYIPQTYYYQFPHMGMQYAADAYSVPQQPVVSTETQASTPSIKSRSRSVADIVKELNDEIQSAKERSVVERSSNVTPTLKPRATKSSCGDKKEEKRKKKSEQLPNPFEKLNSKQRDMCKNIQMMGFPLDRVARVCQLIGDNDKRIVECLLILNELMDLGFSEARVLAALVKHEFNRDKALDELVS